VAAAQQNLRAAKYFLEKELRMAGCDPSETARAGIVTATANSINFTMDINNGNPGTGFPNGALGDANENVTYSLYDSGGDGDMDLGRNTGGGNQLVAENIDALDFVYLDINENPIPFPIANLRAIRSVEVTLLARTGRQIRGWSDPNLNYTNARGTVIYAVPANESNFRRQIVTTRIKCRNLAKP
jgi:type IV pilus assembly protein PilW